MKLKELEDNFQINKIDILEYELVEIFFNEKNYSSEEFEPNINKNEKFRVKEILINVGEYFAPNEPIILISSKLFRTTTFAIVLEYGGIVEFISDCNNFSLNESILLVKKIKNELTLKNNLLAERIEKLDKIKIFKETDDFNGSWTIKFTNILLENNSFLKIYETNSLSYLGLSFVNYNGFSYLNFTSNIDDMPLSKNDEIIFLFENNNRLSVIFEINSSGSKGYKQNRITLNETILKAFLFENLSKIKVTNKKKNTYTICSFKHKNKCYSFTTLKPQYYSEFYGQFVLRFMVYKFITFNLKLKNLDDGNY